MPSETFIKLPEEKKHKIIEAAKEEFSRVSPQDASIKTITQKAGIARGSFYQYFESKKDLLLYILEENRETMEKKLHKIVEVSEGDVFKIYAGIYDDFTCKCFNDMNKDVYKKIFENLKTDDESIYDGVEKKNKEDLDRLKKAINTEKLKIENENDLDLIIQILTAVTMTSVVKSLKYTSKEEAKEEFLRKLNFIKKGIEKC